MNNLSIYLKDLKTLVYERGEVIKNEGDDCKSMQYILSGEVKILTYTYEENIYQINVLKEGEFIAENLMFSSHPIYPGSVIASKKTEIIEISKKEFLKLSKNEDFLLSFLNKSSDFFLHLQNRLKVLSQKTIRDKVMFYLNSKKSDVIYIKSKELLSEYLNIPRPSLSRELISLKNDGIIDFDRHHIYIKKRS